MVSFARHRFERRRVAVSPLAIAAAGAALALVACSGASGPERANAEAARQVTTTVDAFDRAVLARNFATVCDRLFTPEARIAVGGSTCASALAASGQPFRALRVTSVNLRGDYATATVIATEASGPAVAETLELVRRGHRFLISSARGQAEN
ncbi:MAG: hypothetical protein NVS2B6_11470 [Thermoleophilaceae bacterium]